MNNWIFWLFVCFAAALFGCQSNESDMASVEKKLNQPLETHPDLKSGVLPNGLRYYALKTDNGNTTLQLNVGVGSVDEKENERGYAHLVEHMAFQGTQSHSFDALQKLYRDVGLTLGPDVNATTDLYRTQYVVTMSDKDIFDSHFHQFSDWLADVSKGKLLFPAQQLETEKTVVEAERLTRAKNSYANNSWMSFLEGTGVEHRLPLGDQKVVAGATQQKLKDFVSNYYVPSNSTLVVVGNISEARLEYIKNAFGGNEQPIKRAKHLPFVPNLSHFYYQDKDANAFSHALVIGDAQAIDTKVELVKSYLMDSFQIILFERLRQSNDANNNATFGIDVRGSVVSDNPAMSITLDHDNNSHALAVQTLTQELTRLSEYGLTDAEYADFKQKWAAYDVESESQYSSYFVANEIIARVSNGGIYNSLEAGEELVKTVLSQISKPMLDQYLSSWASSPLRWGFSGPSLNQAELEQQIDVAKRVSVPPPSELSLPLVPVPDLLPAKIVEETQKGKTINWQLSNGVKVILEPRDYSDRISFLMIANGGLNGLKTDEEYDAARLAPAVFSQSGQNWIKPAQMERLLRSHKMSLHPLMNASFHGVELQSEAKDATLALSILYNSMQNAAITPSVFEHVKKNTVDSLQTLTANQHFLIQLQQSRSGQEAIRANTTAERFEQVEIENIERLYQKLYKQVDGYTLVVVGKFTPDSIRDDILSFVGGLPQGKRYENRSTPKYQSPNKKEVLSAGGEPGKSHIHFGYTSPALGRPSIKERVAFLIAVSTLNQRLFDSLREENGWVYNVQVQQQYHDGSFSMNLIDADMMIAPEYQQQAIEEVGKQFQRLKKDGITQEELERFKGIFKDSFSSALSDDLNTTYVYGTNDLLGIDYRDAIQFEETFNQLTLDYVNALIPSLINESGRTIGIFNE